ncbi:unnamed protein product [Peniophora sp. CBMAI 1063]|nr:unnamed protein product [Peniophora sp. CBMAI 1063]
MPRKVAAPAPPPPVELPVAGPSSASRRASVEKRRFQPARSRRGGPGVGSTPIDEIILDSLNRRHESDPVIPPTTRFLLTTDSSAAPRIKQPSAPANAPSDRGEGSSRYFEQPAVVAAARAQREIETPEFWMLPEHASVGGRFRARASEDVGADTSDAAYEKRHRKYETFEKRQRLREKEKLKHEHYKLKERIEQLRGMDPSAFLSLDPKLFERDGAPAGEEDADPASMDHIQAQAEGERRKVVLLRVAESLEERYSTLLNPDAHKASQNAAFGSSVDGFSQADSDKDDEEVAEDADEAEVDEDDVLDQDTEDQEIGEEDVDEDEPAPTEDDDDDVDQLDEDVDVDIEEPEPPPPPQNHSTKLRIRLPARGSLSLSNTPTPKPPSISSVTNKKAPRGPLVQTTLSASAPPPSGTRKSTRSTRARPISNGSAPSNVSPSGPSPPHKRQRLSEPVDDHLPFPETDWRKSKLYVFAAQSAPALAARKPVRHLVAFGVKLPEMPHEQEFEVPDFAWPDSVPWEYVDDGEDDEAMVEEVVALEEDGDEAGPPPPQSVSASSSGRVLRHRPES